MTVIVNPFDAGGFTLAEMSAAIQMLPNPYGRVGQLGLFVPEPISQRNVTIESIEGELRLLPAVAPGAPATFGTTDVSLLSTRVRRIMSTQTLVAFVYNTVVVAIVVSLLVSSNPGPPAAG